jgi:hypothetical protein
LVQAYLSGLEVGYVGDQRCRIGGGDFRLAQRPVDLSGVAFSDLKQRAESGDCGGGATHSDG